MPSELLIAEKPSACKKIADALADGKPIKRSEKKVSYYEITHGKNDIIVASAVGHLYGIAQKGEKGWTYPVFDVEWKPTYEMSKGADYSKDYVDVLRKLSNNLIPTVTNTATIIIHIRATPTVDGNHD